ncbi:hypothetical protein ACFQ60_04040 [Streptomyces zhihengii]|uniref:Uncharacterized protein n=1 Tax=Streptomyces zhihengii TaxID=1818004 RepID=A0ABS2V2L7_9ACTN|nr:hypothetical protein [Streptomyces zhihengii]MBM9623924.1 hypothetical protein [Streptomyces zhihengii]
MSTHHPKREAKQVKESPSTAGEEILHEAEEAETSVTSDGERSSDDGEASDALSPNEDAQEDVHHRSE